MVSKLKKKNTILCTSRRYREVSALAEIRRFPVKLIGKHGGGGKLEKLEASLDRMKTLSKEISKFSPDLVISFCSPEASRIAYGLGVNHIAFSDSPHATAVMKLSIPFIQKLLIPWIIPKKEFTKFGISQNNIIQYRSIDAATITKRNISNKTKLPYNTKKKTILIRPAEDQAAYVGEKNITVPIIRSILKKFKTENIVVLSRYTNQRKNLKKIFGDKIKVLNMSYDGKLLLENCDVFIGSGGTMTAESALLGVPTISYDAVPNFIEEYLIKKKLAIRERESKKIVAKIDNILSSKNLGKKRAKREVSSMEDPYSKLTKVIKSIK